MEKNTWNQLEEAQSESNTVGMPFLARFMERIDEPALPGSYDESTDLWLYEDKPLAASNHFALETMTLTRTGGEGQDTD